jgi:hypothetical protein
LIPSSIVKVSNRRAKMADILFDEKTLRENREQMAKGELYYAFTPDLIAARSRCQRACERLNNAGEVPRRRLVELWRE